MPSIATWIAQLHLLEAAFFFLVLNVFVVIGSALLWQLLRRFHLQSLRKAEIHPIDGKDIAMVIGTIVMNTIVSVGGWYLWQQGIITLSQGTWLDTLLRFLGMVLFMDVVMYVSHRAAHWKYVYEYIHKPHHLHRKTNMLSLFVLHPFEVLGFGSMLVVSIWLFSPTEAALLGYLHLNTLFGTVGHAGLWLRDPEKASFFDRWIGTSQFHCTHHEDENYNFGFYTTLWDTLGKTYASGEESSG